MKCLSLHINLDPTEEFDRQAFLRIVRGMERYPEVDVEKDAIVLHFFTEQLAQLWQQLQLELFETSAFADLLNASAIVVCDGDEEDEELLLFHFDQKEILAHL